MMSERAAPSESRSSDPRTYRPARVRGVFAGAALAVGLIFRFAVRLPVEPVFFALVIGWYVTVLLFFRWSSRRERSRLYFPARALYFGVEIVVAAWAAHSLGVGSWLAVLFVLFPVLEWNLLFPGRRGLTGSLAAVLVCAALLVGEALAVIPRSPVLRELDPTSGALALALGALLISAGVLIGLSAAAGIFASVGPRKSRELEAAYAELRSTQAELVNSARLATLGTLVGGVAHEINTPLGALNSNCDVIMRALQRLQVILADERVDESELEEVRKIVKAINGVMATNHMAVDRMVQIVGNLRNFGRPDRAELDRVDVHEGLESTLQLLSHQLEGRIEVVREYGEFPLVECYPNQLNQAFMNLLLNACQAIPGEGTISLRTYASGDDNVAIEIRDTGTGIATENLDEIFEPGFTTKGSRMGMGMGLLISRQIVQRHGGRIDVDSTVGEGTAFTIVLPMRARSDERGTVGMDPRNTAR